MLLKLKDDKGDGVHITAYNDSKQTQGTSFQVESTDRFEGLGESGDKFRLARVKDQKEIFVSKNTLSNYFEEVLE